MAKELEAMASKSPAKALNLSTTVAPTALVTGYSGRIVKRYGN